MAATRISNLWKNLSWTGVALLIGRAGTGKTAMGLRFAHHFAKQNVPTVVLTGEHSVGYLTDAYTRRNGTEPHPLVTLEQAPIQAAELDFHKAMTPLVQEYYDKGCRLLVVDGVTHHVDGREAAEWAAAHDGLSVLVIRQAGRKLTDESVEDSLPPEEVHALGALIWVRDWRSLTVLKHRNYDRGRYALLT